MEDKYKLPFDLKEATKTNVLTTGSNSSGKTLLNCSMVSILDNIGQVVAIDTSGTWKKKSDIPYYWMVNYFGEPYPIPQHSIIYDVSRLRIDDQKAFTETIALWLWDRQIRNSSMLTWLVLEEAQLYLRNIRGRISQNVLRLLSVGRNVNVRCLIISPNLNLIDAEAIRLCGQRFHGKLAIEENAKRKFKAYYGSDYTRIATEGLQCGSFLHVVNDKIQVVSVPEFKTKQMPIQYVIPEPRQTIKHVAFQKKRKKTWIEKLEKLLCVQC